MTIAAINNLTDLPGKTANAPFRDDLKILANQVVNQVFYGTLMREFRNARPDGIFNKGPGGTTFIRQLDMELVSRISQRGGAPLVSALVKQLGGQHSLTELRNKINTYEHDSKLHKKGLINV